MSVQTFTVCDQCGVRKQDDEDMWWRVDIGPGTLHGFARPLTRRDFCSASCMGDKMREFFLRDLVPRSSTAAPT